MNIIILKGGLGNQLFQLSKFIYLSEELDLKNLKIDYFSGFFLDFKYRRKLEIKQVKKISSLSLKNLLFNIFILTINKFCSKLTKVLGVKIITDSQNSYEYFLRSKNCLFNGYFQKFSYASNNIEKIYKIIKPNLKVKTSKKFKKIYLKINSCENPVAIGIRFYEESNNPLIHQNPNSSFKTPNDFNKIIMEIESVIDNPSFFVFIQNENEFTSKLEFKSPFYFVTHDLGYVGSWPRLKAQICCSHHLFNNSTFYYWGALLSEYLNKKSQQQRNVYISDNFIFPEIYNPKWKKF